MAQRYFDTARDVALWSAGMGRLVAIVLLVAAAGIAVIAVNGPGKDKPVTDRLTPVRESSHVTTVRADGSVVTPGEPVSARAPVGATVVMRNLAFAPSVVRVRAGQSVRFVNHDDVAHTVLQNVGARSGELPLFESGRIVPGRTFTWIAQVPGTYRYICTLHPSVMSGRIVVSGSNA
jgi:plastocyanin